MAIDTHPNAKYVLRMSGRIPPPLSELVEGSTILLNLWPETDVPKVLVSKDLNKKTFITLENSFPTHLQPESIIIEREYRYLDHHTIMPGLVGQYGTKDPQFKEKADFLRRFGLA